MNKLIVFIVTFLFCCSSFSYVIEDENEAKENGLTLYKVLTCAFYPETGNRDFYFSATDAKLISYQEAQKALTLENQRKCLFSMYEEGDKLYRFNKNFGPSKEKGITLVRKDKVIAIAFIEAIYAN